VQRVLYSKEIEHRKLYATDGEIVLQITQNPQNLPPAISQNPNFMTDGKFDMSKYQEALGNPQVDWTPIENYVREILPFQKLQEIISASVVVTEQEVKEDYISNNVKAKIKYLQVPISAFAKDSVEVNEKDVEIYYQENKGDFKVEEKRKLIYVLFSTEPSSADSQKVLQLVEEIKMEAESGEDFAELADEYSEDPSAKNNHGDLGYFERDRMVKEFSDAAFAAKAGQIVGPIRTNFGIHIIKIHDRKMEEGEEKVHASHILFKYTPSALTLEQASSNAANFVEEARETGFSETAEKLNYELRETPEFTKGNYIPGFGQMLSAIQWTFKAGVNEISNVYRSTQGYVVFELSNILPEGFRLLDEVRDVCKSRVEREKRMGLAKDVAVKIGEKITQNISFKEIKANDQRNIMVLDSTNEFSGSQSIPRIGRSPEISAAAFSINIGANSSLLETNQGYYYIQVLDRTAFNEEDYKIQRTIIRNRLINQKAQRFFAEWYDKLKEKADIKDNRDLFFAS
jgi:parvulin-like peptidyl-prolyl isomerase